MKVFGCVAFLRIPKEIVNGNFNSRSYKCYFTGYRPNGYRFWCPELKKTISGKDVVFEEQKFSLEDTSSDFWIPSNSEIDQRELDDKEDVSREPFMNLKYNTDETQSDGLRETEEGINSIQPEKNTMKKLANIEPRRSTRLRNKQNYLNDYAVIALNAELFIECT